MSATPEVDLKLGRAVSNTPWPSRRLGDITEPGAPALYGILQPGPDTPGGVPYVRPTEISEDIIQLDEIRRTTPEIAAKYRRSLLQTEDIILSIVGTIGKVALVPPELEGGNITQSSVRIRPRRDLVLPRFLTWFLRSPIATRQYDAARLGTAVPRLNVAHVRDLLIPIPPLSEQRTIVAEIEKQSTRLDAGIAALRRTQANLKRYRASVIENTLAVDWPTMQVSEIGEIVTGTTPSPTDEDNYGGYLPFVTPADLNAGYYLDSAARHLSSKGTKLARPLPERSVLVTCIGATIGKTGLARIRCATNQQINAFIPHDMAVSPEWAFWMFSSPSGQRQIRENASATTLPILNKTRFGMLRIPIPPLDVQSQLVAEIERKLTIADTIQKTLIQNIRRADRLRRTLLEASFADRLISA